MHGVGTFATVDGSCYTGSWAEDHKQGLGRKTYPNGDVYEVGVLEMVLRCCGRMEDDVGQQPC